MWKLKQRHPTGIAYFVSALDSYPVFNMMAVTITTNNGLAAINDNGLVEHQIEHKGSPCQAFMTSPVGYYRKIDVFTICLVSVVGFVAISYVSWYGTTMDIFRPTRPISTPICGHYLAPLAPAAARCSSAMEKMAMPCLPIERSIISRPSTVASCTHSCSGLFLIDSRHCSRLSSRHAFRIGVCLPSYAIVVVGLACPIKRHVG